MIRVTVQLIPFGIEERARTLQVLEIANDGSGDKDLGNYTAKLHAEYTGINPRTGEIKAFKRKTQSVWSLVGAALKMFGHTEHSPKNLIKKK